MNEKFRIGITACGKYDNYRHWIEGSGQAEAVRLNYSQNNADEMANCKGLVLTGGEDVSPELYGRAEFAKEYALKEIIQERDEFEFAVIRKALDQKKPILGICRGLQVMNVYLGGTLIPDIPAFLHSGFHGKINGTDQQHTVTITPDSRLRQISGLEAGLVNSAHHQSADTIAKDLKITAFGDTDIVEAMEWIFPEKCSWLLLVQWHPERMADQASPLANRIRIAFLEACRNFRTTNADPYLNPALHPFHARTSARVRND
jgi:putative glutamine amidotransferase